MVPQVLSRSQRRIERQQALLLLALVLAVSLVSFALGVMVGRGKGEPSAAATAAAPVARLPVSPPAAGGGMPGTQDLTFYESLPKGGKPPLGSGINLPAIESAPRNPAAAQPQVATPAPGSPSKSQAPAPSAVTPLPTSPPAGQAAVARIAPAADPSPTRPQAKAAGGAWTIQAGSFQGVEDAQRLKQRLVGKGFAVFIQEAALGAKGTWYRVIVGPFESEGAASGAASRLREEEKLSVMIRRS